MLIAQISPLRQELAKQAFPFGQTRPGYDSGKPDPVLFGDAVQHSNRRPVPEKDPLGIHSH